MNIFFISSLWLITFTFGSYVSFSLEQDDRYVYSELYQSKQAFG